MPKLGDLADIQMGYPFRSRLEHDPQGDVAVIQMKDIDDANLLRTDEAIRVQLPSGKTHHLLRPGDLLFRSRGRSNGATLVLEGIDLAILSAPMLLIRPHKVLPEYLCWYINAPASQAQLAAMSEGTSVRMISAESIKTLDVLLPSLATQQRIVYLAALAEKEQALLARIARLRKNLANHSLMKLADPSSNRTIQ